jgi:DNA-directed RNA polymerase subunit M/transcription elongation factor TFIIS
MNSVTKQPTIKFCKNCETSLVYSFADNSLTMKCPNCLEIYEKGVNKTIYNNISDKQLDAGIIGSNLDIDTIIADPTIAFKKMSCPLCKKSLVMKKILNENGRAIYICPLCKKEYYAQ